MNRSALVRFIAFLGVLAVLVGYVAYHRPPTSGNGGTQTTTTPPTNTSTQTANYFQNLKQSRDSLMSKEIATLRTLVSNSSVSAMARSQAESTLVQDEQEWKQAMQVEGVLSAHGFPLTVVTLDPNSAQIVVAATSLTTTQVAAIADTTTQITGIAPQDIVIIPRTGPSGGS